MTLPAPVAVGDPVRASTFDQLIGAGTTAASGSQVMGATVANTPKTVAVSFPAGRFSSAPIVLVSSLTSVPGTVITGVGVSGVSATGCNVTVTSSSTLSGATVYWLAVNTP